MALRNAYAPELPEMDSFLFAPVGGEVNGIPLSVLSALARLGLDPRAEAARLSRLTSDAAASQLGRLLARLPDRPWTAPDILRIAAKLVELLPAAPKGGEGDQVTGASHGKLSSTASPRLIYLALALSGALVFAHGHVASDGHETAPPVSQADPTAPSAPMRSHFPALAP
jgi:hypothetical protein